MAAPDSTSSLHRIRRGLDLPLAGAPQQQVDGPHNSTHVALLATDQPGLKPSFLVQPGDRVRRGQWLYQDKGAPGVGFAAPAAGEVVAIHRGDYRAFQSLVIRVEGDDAPDAQQVWPAWPACAGVPPDRLAADDLRALLLQSGLWTALRRRPYSKVPAADATPGALFVTAIDTRPHAPDVNIVMAGRHADFTAGVQALSRLTAGTTYICTGAGFQAPVPTGPTLHHAVFEGPHPAGNAGTHIHLLYPVDHERSAWHVGYQDVLAIGHLLRTGQLDSHRVVALAGPAVQRPRLLRVPLGASVDALTQGEVATAGSFRRVSGSVLDGRTAGGEVHGWLGRYHQQVTVLAEATEREFFGWILPSADKFSIWGVVLGAFSGKPLALNTTTNGGERAMVPIGAFERVMPLDLMPTFLLRALLMAQDERAEKLGVLELDEEDLALCTFVCPGKAEYGPLLRQALTRIEKEAA